MAIIKTSDAGIVGWMLATDRHDLERRARGTLDDSIVDMVAKIEDDLPTGKYILAPGIVLLIE